MHSSRFERHAARVLRNACDRADSEVLFADSNTLCAFVQYRQDACAKDPWILGLHRDREADVDWLKSSCRSSSRDAPTPDEYDFDVPLESRHS
jgi:hypothetical protein